EDRELDRATTVAPVLRCERQAEPAELGKLRPDLAAEARLACRDPLERAVVVALTEEFLGALAQEDVFAVVSKVHTAIPAQHGVDPPRPALARRMPPREHCLSSTDRRPG